MKIKYLIFTIIASTSILAHAEPNTDKNGGFFIAYNDTNHIVTITVGNFFPTPYTIAPYSSTWVPVSTDNQNIHITDIH